jgi:hypothetical protein
MALLDKMCVAMAEGGIHCEAWQANHIVTCIRALAQLDKNGINVDKWRAAIGVFAASLQSQIDSLHEGDLFKLQWSLGQLRVPNGSLFAAVVHRELDLPEVRDLGQMLCMATRHVFAFPIAKAHLTAWR